MTTAIKKRPMRRYTVLKQGLLFGGDERQRWCRGRRIRSLEALSATTEGTEGHGTAADGETTKHTNDTKGGMA